MSSNDNRCRHHPGGENTEDTMKKRGSTPNGKKVSTNEKAPTEGVDTGLPLKMVDQRTYLTLPLGRKPPSGCRGKATTISNRYIE